LRQRGAAEAKERGAEACARSIRGIRYGAGLISSTMVMYDYDRKAKGTLSDELRDVLLKRIQVAEEQSS
jgi:hypothetical protein